MTGWSVCLHLAESEQSVKSHVGLKELEQTYKYVDLYYGMPPSIKTVHCKKRLAAFPYPAGMSLTKLSLAGNYQIFPGFYPARESLVSDIPAKDGKIA
jgi:hypothetical protein